MCTYVGDEPQRHVSKLDRSFMGGVKASIQHPSHSPLHFLSSSLDLTCYFEVVFSKFCLSTQQMSRRATCGPSAHAYILLQPSPQLGKHETTDNRMA
jgi:hypothetical protein